MTVLDLVRKRRLRFERQVPSKNTWWSVKKITDVVPDAMAFSTGRVHDGHSKRDCARADGSELAVEIPGNDAYYEDRSAITTYMI